jgi:hypothetical protein
MHDAGKRTHGTVMLLATTACLRHGVSGTACRLVRWIPVQVLGCRAPSWPHKTKGTAVNFKEEVGKLELMERQAAHVQMV